MPPRYQHRQHAPLGWLLGAGGAAALAGSALVGEPAAVLALAAFGLLLLLTSAMFLHLTVREEPGHLAVRFGPLPLFGTQIRYDRMQSVAAARSKLVDGWGVHWVPGRGWTFNLWGRDCVEVTTDRGIVRIGTDDREGLLRHLQGRLGAGPTRTPAAAGPRQGG